MKETGGSERIENPHEIPSHCSLWPVDHVQPYAFQVVVVILVLMACRLSIMLWQGSLHEVSTINVQKATTRSGVTKRRWVSSISPAVLEPGITYSRHNTRRRRCLREASCRAATKAPTLWFAQVADDRVVSALDEILNREVDSRISRRRGIAPTGTASVPN